MGSIAGQPFSRLMLGGNLISGWAHARDLGYVGTLMRRYNSEAKIRETLELAEALTTLLPPDQAKQVRAPLGESGVRVVRIGTLLERMSFDKDVIALRAGRPVEFVFE